MKPEPDFRLIFRGGRYDAGLPVGVMARLAALEAGIEAIGRDLFMETHADRKRVGAGFKQGFRLLLTEFKPGSAITGFNFSTVEQSVELLTHDAVIQLIEGVMDLERDDRSPNLPRKAFKGIFDLVDGMESTETIELHSNNHTLMLDTTKVARIQEAAQRERSGPREEVIVGHVTAVDEAGHFTLRRRETGSRHTLDLADEHRHELPTLLSQSVRIRVVGELDNDGQLLGRRKVTQLERVVGPSISKRFQDLRQIRPGWLDGAGEVPTASFLKKVEDLAWRFVEAGTERPYAYPMPDGGIQLEWDGISFSISPGLRVEADCIYLPESDRFIEGADLGTATAWLLRAWQATRRARDGR